MNEQQLSGALEHFKTLLQEQAQRVERMRAEQDWVDYSALAPIRIGRLRNHGSWKDSW